MYFLSTNQIKQDAQPEKIKSAVPKHIQWVNEQIAVGTIIQAGKWGNIGGMCIISAENKQMAADILDGDPLIQAELTDFLLDEFYPDVPLQ